MLKIKTTAIHFLKTSLILVLFVTLIQSAQAADFKTNLGTGFSSNSINVVNVESSGKILVGGGFGTLNGNSRSKLLRLNASGTEDAAFYANLGTGFGLTVTNILLQSDNKVLVGGDFTTLNGGSRKYLVRLNSDGTEDADFYSNLGTGFNSSVRDTALQSDGKIIIGGAFTSFNGNALSNIVRLNSSGTEDTIFSTNLSGFNFSPLSIDLQTDGKIIIAGTGGASKCLMRLDGSGIEDTAFATNLGVGCNNPAFSSAIQPDGKIVVGGRFTVFNGVTRNNLIRVNASGTEDTSFYSNLGTGFNDVVYSIAIQSDGKILVAGAFTTFNGNTRNHIVRLNADGTEDTAFYTNLGSGFNQLPYLALQADGKILVGGYFSTFNGNIRNGLVRLNADGTEDLDLTPPVITMNGAASSTITMGSTYTDPGSTALDNLDGNVSASTTATSTLNTSYSGVYTIVYRAIDTSGNVAYATRTVNVYLPPSPLGFYQRMGAGFNAPINAINFQNDGKIVTGGSFTTFASSTRNRLIRLSASGTEDTSFTTNIGSGFNNVVRTSVMQQDNKIIVGGNFTLSNGATANRLKRLNSNGTTDTTFSTGLGTGFGNNYVTSVALQADGKILVGGAFTLFNGSARNLLIKLNASGVEDASFSTNLGAGFVGTYISNISLQSDGKILVGGNFTALGSTTHNNIVRLYASGTEDTLFTTNVGAGFNGAVNTSLLQSDGKILLGGSFTSLNGFTTNRFVRLNSDGTVDSSFSSNLGAGFNGAVNTTLLQPDNKILVGGNFTTFDGTLTNRLIRLNSDGTKDNTFATNLGSGLDSEVFTLLRQWDGKIVAGGDFTIFNGKVRNGIIRLNADGTEDLDLISPVITVTGSNPASVTVGTTYTDAGSTAFDAIDGDVTASTTSTSTVNTSVVGAYTVVYTATDLSGNLAYATRTVSVIAAVSSGGGGGGSSSGGSGGYYVPQLVVQTSTTSKATTTIQSNSSNLSQIKVSTLSVYLYPNIVNEEVKTLQRFLNTHGYVVRVTGAGSPGYEVTRMGPTTVTALKKYQKNKGITANGYVGAKTRESINAVLLSEKSTSTQTIYISPVNASTTSVVATGTLPLLKKNKLTILLYPNIVNEEVKTLQRFLNTHGYVVRVTGAGSLGNESSRMDVATVSALKKYQKDKGIKANGYVGPLTRQYINETLSASSTQR